MSTGMAPDYHSVTVGAGFGTWYWNTYPGIAVEPNVGTNCDGDYSRPAIIAIAQAMCPSKPSDSAIAR